MAIRYAKDSSFRTRDILYVKGLLGNDSLHLFINHWPSRYGGLLETNDIRLAAAKRLKAVTDSICHIQPSSAVLVMGDFNDNPSDESIQYLTRNEQCPLLSIQASTTHEQVKGTLKYRGNWELFDQVLVSEGMSNGCSGIAIVNEKAHIFSPDFLLKKDERYLGVKPLRTYEGFNYTNGFSDHLPIFVDIYHHKPK
jgi:endonuclease/exonuclease/phosphatase family metal-dependent hydrolase